MVEDVFLSIFPIILNFDNLPALPFLFTLSQRQPTLRGTLGSIQHSNGRISRSDAELLAGRPLRDPPQREPGQGELRLLLRRQLRVGGVAAGVQAGGDLPAEEAHGLLAGVRRRQRRGAEEPARGRRRSGCRRCEGIAGSRSSSRGCRWLAEGAGSRRRGAER